MANHPSASWQTQARARQLLQRRGYYQHRTQWDFSGEPVDLLQANGALKLALDILTRGFDEPDGHW